MENLVSTRTRVDRLSVPRSGFLARSYTAYPAPFGRDQDCGPETDVRGNWITGPTFLAAVVTLANVAKPVVVDDAAYLMYARHIAAHPLDPYGFSMFWYSAPSPAMAVLCPPVVPYWLAAGIALFGEHVAVLKLWYYPFVWLYAWSLREVLRRFARGAETAALPLIVLSPTVLPTVNLMLDIPAAALGLAALVLMIRAADRGSVGRAVAAGVVAAFAMQTKYTALIVPPLLVWYGLTHRRARLATVAAATTIVLFASWELFLVASYGESHFLHHLIKQGEASPGRNWFDEFFDDKVALGAPLLAYLGCLAVGIGLFAGRAIGVPRKVMAWFAAVWVVGVVLIAVLPYDTTTVYAGRERPHEKISLSATVWRTTGAIVLLTDAASAGLLLLRFRHLGWRRSADSWFVVGWVVLELAGYFAMTPFPAARRVIGVAVVSGVLLARLVSRMNRARADRRVPGWVVPFGVATGFGVAAIDTFDAYPEKVIAGRAVATIREHSPHARGWYTGHWGFQYYCERGGLTQVYERGPTLEVGDYLVVPIYPDPDGFYRPAEAGGPIYLPSEVAVPIGEPLVWDDLLSAQTVPNFYGGVAPIVGRNHPRLRVQVFRLIRPWAVTFGKPDQFEGPDPFP